MIPERPRRPPPKQDSLLKSFAGEWLLLRAVAAFTVGIVALASPGITAAIFVVLFGIYAIADGLFALLGAIVPTRRLPGGHVWQGVTGVLGIAAGLVALVWPNAAAIAFVYVVAAWAVVTGVAEIFLGMIVRSGVLDELMLIVAGALSIVFGVAVVAQPAGGVIAIVWLMGVYCLLLAMVRMLVALRLRRSDDHDGREWGVGD